MLKHLLILRHGKAEPGTPDYGRGLLDRGKRGSQKIGQWLVDQALVPDRVLSSSAKRARETAERAIKTAGLRVADITLETDMYLAAPATLAGFIHREANTCERLLLVGHNPGFEDLVDLLATNSQCCRLKTASMAHLTVDGWNGNIPVCTLQQVVAAGDLPYQFPFGEGLRERPAYYFTQSGVIPYRIDNNQLQVLLVRKHGGTKWGIPKGVVEPGLSAAESAAREALAEAGAVGRVTSASLGTTEIKKWGATCSLEVFPMRVDELRDSWDNQKWERAWFSIDGAQERVRLDALRPMLETLGTLVAT